MSTWHFLRPKGHTGINLAERGKICRQRWEIIELQELREGAVLQSE